MGQERTHAPSEVVRIPPPGKGRGVRRWIFAVTTLVVVFVILSEVSLRLLSQHNKFGMLELGNIALLPFRPEHDQVVEWWRRTLNSKYVVLDPELGWTLARNGRNRSRHYATNGQAIRTEPTRIFAAAPPEHVHRIVAVGDSFTHCDDVSLEGSWPYLLESQRSDLEVLNLGVPGYGTDQAYLRWQRDGRAFRAHVVILGIWPEDICRNLNWLSYYLMPRSGFKSKPRFKWVEDELHLINSPVADIEDHARCLSSPNFSAELTDEFWISDGERRFKPLYVSRTLRVMASLRNMMRRRAQRHGLMAGEDPTANVLTVRIAQRFAADVQGSGSVPVVLVFPMRELLDQFGERNTLPLVTALQESGLHVIDLMKVFGQRAADDGPAAYFHAGGHLNPHGNRIVAEELGARLDRLIGLHSANSASASKRTSAASPRSGDGGSPPSS